MVRKAQEPKNVAVTHEGLQITLPVVNGKPMTYKAAIEWLQRKERADETAVRIFHTFECGSPLDGLMAFHNALAERYGWVESVPTPGFFGNNPPVMIGIPVSPTETKQVPFGRIEIPGIKGHLATGISTSPKPAFVLGGEVLQKHKPEIDEIVKLIEKQLREHSIYKGKAIRVDFSWMQLKSSGEPVRGFDPMQDAPKFMVLDPASDGNLIFSEQVQSALNVGLWTPIEQAEACRRYKVPLKRGILLYGPYGVGKTLTANVTAGKATRNGWTFIYLNDIDHLAEGLRFAAAYAPAVVFAEDIDRVMNGERNLSMDEVLNILDGIDTKNGEIITVFTTNHVETLNPAVLRMGRLDSLIEVLPPDADAATRLIQLYGRGLLEPSTDLRKVSAALAGKIPAFIREVVERAKIAAIGRTNGGTIEGAVREVDLLAATHAMEAHDKLIWPRKKGPQFVKKFISISNEMDIAPEWIEERPAASNGDDMSEVGDVV